MRFQADSETVLLWEGHPSQVIHPVQSTVKAKPLEAGSRSYNFRNLAGRWPVKKKES